VIEVSLAVVEGDRSHDAEDPPLEREPSSRVSYGDRAARRSGRLRRKAQGENRSRAKAS
jgi:hypothetical protein